MRLILISIALLCVSISAQAQQCGKGEMATPNGCIRVCPPGDYEIIKQNDFDTCQPTGNQQVGTHQRKYAFLPIRARDAVDGICFGIRPDERVETVVVDRFVEADWHVRPHEAYVAQISYKLDPGLTKLHVMGFRYWRADANRKPVGAGDLIEADADVPLYDAPQANWPCTKRQWTAIMSPPQIVSAPPPGTGITIGPTPIPYVPPRAKPGELYPGENWSKCHSAWC